MGSSSSTPDTFSSAAVADWYELRKNATSWSGAKKFRTYSTAAASTPISSAPPITRPPPHSSTTATETEATAISAGSNVPNSRIERMLTSRYWPARSPNSSSLRGSLRNAFTARMPVIVSTNLTITCALTTRDSR
ncbi:hypothetical protein RKD05_000398 [Microbacterium sp. SLBN-111]